MFSYITTTLHSMGSWCLIYTTSTHLDFSSASSLKQQSTGRYVAPLRHIILIPSQPVFVFSPECCMLSREATNTNFIVFGLILLEYYQWKSCVKHQSMCQYLGAKTRKVAMTYSFLWFYSKVLFSDSIFFFFLQTGI